MDRTKIDTLSRQQRRCLRAVGRGLNSLEIAHELGIAESTVNGHIESAVRKLGAPNRRHAAFALGESERICPPEKIPGENLPLDPMSFSPADPASSKVRDVASFSSFDLKGYLDRTDAPDHGETENEDLARPLRTITFVIVIAAGISLILVAFPSLVENARTIANAIQPYQANR